MMAPPFAIDRVADGLAMAEDAFEEMLLGGEDWVDPALELTRKAIMRVEHHVRLQRMAAAIAADQAEKQA